MEESIDDIGIIKLTNAQTPFATILIVEGSN